MKLQCLLQLLTSVDQRLASEDRPEFMNPQSERDYGSQQPQRCGHGVRTVLKDRKYPDSRSQWEEAKELRAKIVELSESCAQLPVGHFLFALSHRAHPIPAT